MNIHFVALLLTLAGCGSKTTGQSAGTPPVIQPKTDQLVWDQSTRRRVSTGSSVRYSGYARMVQLRDTSLLAVYEADGTVVAVKSQDSGNSWLKPVVVAARKNGTNMTVPDVLELADGSILVCYNPRPYQIDPARRFGIRTKKSRDGPLTWHHE